MFELLKKLTHIPAVSGSESTVAEFIIDEIKGCGDYHIDRLGNLIVHKEGKNRPQTKLMLCAHMDEVGLMITYITDDGMLKFDAIGGIDPRVIAGRRVKVGKSGLNGVISVKPVHLLSDEDKKAAPSIDKLYIDIGAASKEDALKYARPGDTVIFDSEYIEFGEGLIKAKAIDDRIGCAILIKLIKSDLEYDCEFAFTVQEEVGTRGAATAAFALRPDAAIVIEATTAADIPFVDDDKKVCYLGQGPVLSFMDRHTIYNRDLYELAMDTAKNNNIPCQAKLAVSGGNDAGAIHTSGEGVKTLAISLPCRYLHSPSCVIKSSDAEDTLKLVTLLASEIASKK